LPSYAYTNYSLFVNGYSDNYTPSVPTVDFFGSWKGAKSYKAADLATANNFIQTGAQYSKFSAAIFYRYDYYLTMHKDVAEYRYTFHNDRDNLLDKDYIYDFRERRLDSHGLRLGYKYKYSSKLAITSYINLHSSSKFQDRDIKDGHTNGKTRLGDAQANYHFSKDTLYGFLNVDEALQGYGFSLDIDANYQVNDDLKLEFTVKDLFHFITWDESPYAQGSFQVDHFLYDGQDVLQQKPLANLQTHEGGKPHSYTYNLPVRLSFSAQQTLFDHYELSLKYQYNEIVDALTVKAGYSPWTKTQFAFSYNFERKAFGLHTKYHAFYLDVITDKADFGYANALGLFIGYEVKL
jgi:hypothetical protein